MKKKILVADDILEQRELLRLLFRGAPFEATFASDGTEALRIFREMCARGERFDLILLDGAMPEMSGIGAAEEIRKEEAGCEARIKFLTNLDIDSDPVLFARIKLIGCDKRDVWSKVEMSASGRLVSAIMRELEDEGQDAEHYQHGA